MSKEERVCGFFFFINIKYKARSYANGYSMCKSLTQLNHIHDK